VNRLFRRQRTEMILNSRQAVVATGRSRPPISQPRLEVGRLQETRPTRSHDTSSPDNNTATSNRSWMQGLENTKGGRRLVACRFAEDSKTRLWELLPVDPGT